MLFLSIPAAPHPLTLDAVAVGAAQCMLISEFYPSALCSDEYFAIANAGPNPVNLRNWSITDGEGTITFLPDLVVSANDMLAASANASSFEVAFGREPGISFANRSSVLCTGTFRLADAGDAIWLKRPDGSIADFVAYGDSATDPVAWTGPPLPRIRQGEVAKRVAVPSLRDSNRSTDWFPFREYRYGFTETPVFGTPVPSGSVIAFVSPDCSLETVLSGIETAKTSLRLCTYELDSVPVCRALIDAHHRGVCVRILVDGSPAGGLDDDEVACLSVLAAAGASVLAVNGNLTQDSVQHIGALHAKYMVVDGARSFVLSENFVKSGLPPDPLFGNRGWGVEVVDIGLGSHLSRLFDSDSRSDRTDVIDWRRDPRCDEFRALPEEPMTAQCRPQFLPFVTTNEARVQAIVSPDASVAAPYLANLITTSSEILISQFQADVAWDSRWTGLGTSPLVESVISAMRAGAVVRGLFDSSWYNLEGNKRIVGFLSGLARNESLDGAFAQVDPRSPISILHNKGVILDGKKTLVSSNNWCFASFARNRELALLIDSAEVASYFRRAFDMDWTPDTTDPIADAGSDRTSRPGREIVLDGRFSTDDRAIASWSWDLGVDGTVDCSEPVYELALDRPGRYRVALRVTDAWGNEGSDTVCIDVSTTSGPSAPGLPSSAPWWAAPISGALGTLVGVLLARKKMRAHKVNHGDGI